MVHPYQLFLFCQIFLFPLISPEVYLKPCLSGVWKTVLTKHSIMPYRARNTLLQRHLHWNLAAQSKQ